MNTLKGGLAAALACAALAFPVLSTATPLFSDNFDSDAAASVLNFTGFVNWDVSDGTVDYIRSGGFGISCHGGSGGCVDLDGSTGNAGILTSKTAFNLTAGTEYTLSFWLSGNQRGGAPDTLSYGIGSVTGLLSDIPSDQPFTQYTLTFTPTADFMGNIFFSLAGGDNVGAILDDVQLSAAGQNVGVPEPGSLGLLALGLLALGLLGLATRRTGDGRD